LFEHGLFGIDSSFAFRHSNFSRQRSLRAYASGRPSAKKDYCMSILQPGTPAPDFALPSKPGESIKLSDLRGKPVVLVFYPADWSPVCGDQLALYNEIFSEFKKHDAQVLGISVDGIFCHQAYSKSRSLEFPLLADFEPKGKVSSLFGAYRKGDGFSERALFVIDKAGTVQWSYLSPIGENPGADGILSALEEMGGK
jgi:peroxiredoxin